MIDFDDFKTINDELGMPQAIRSCEGSGPSSPARPALTTSSGA